jgi:NAD(P)-dependent dehydrogenase (short-subunit alcohol dehydrogenase family)
VEITGTVAIVTGGGSGLGAGTARRLSADGSTVVIVDRHVERGSAVAEEIGGHFFNADVADPERIQQAVDLASGLGDLRVLVNCAGISRASRTVSRSGAPFDLEQYEFVLRVNLIGTFNCIRLAAAAMAALATTEGGDRGAIVNTASSAAFEGQAGQAAYSASKGGIVSMTLPIARDLSIHNIRINTIAPGMFDTPIFGKGSTAEAFRARLEPNLVYPDRPGYPSEFAEMVVQLLRNGYMNGEVVRLDGAARLAKE